MGRGHSRIAACALMAAVAWSCGSPPPPEPGPDAAVLCATDLDCDDASFCSGVERCMPDAPGADGRGCVRAEPPCMPSQRCSDAEARCVTSCAVDADADGDGADAVECGGVDCDDADAARHPGNAELCDDAGHDEDCDPATFGERDRDEDGHIDAACCNATPEGAPRCGDDCADQRRDVRPGLPEVCDGLDQDCDAAVDEGVLAMGWADADHDLHGDPMAPLEACPGDPGFSRTSDDCDDAAPARHGAQLEICDGADNDCDATVDESPVAVPWYRDDDGDGFGRTDEVSISCAPLPGFALRGRDCGDDDPDVSPAARERCNGVDDDCDGRADFAIAGGDTEDDDGDGAADRTCGGPDCDDARADVAPGAPELADARDNDCDAAIDDMTGPVRWYLDLDGDGFGDESAGFVESDAPVAGRVTRGGDCDDGSIEVRPGVRDACGGGDGDCDGVEGDDDARVPFFTDADGDGWGVGTTAGIVIACAPPAGSVDRTGDCADDVARVHPSADETCDTLDEDCDAIVDEDSERTWYLDADGDGYGTDASSMVGCLPPSGHVAAGGDCLDTRPDVRPGAAELCDAADQDCDGVTDEGAAASCAVLGGVGACTAGACAIASCTGGRGDCDLAFTTGCEVDTDRSSGHCGACGASCELGDTCGRAAPGACDASPIVALVGGGASGASNEGAFFVALRGTGGAVSWGANAYGALGRGAGGAIPDTVMLPEIVQISAGIVHTCARTRDGRAFCWGYNGDGRLGDGGVGGARSTPLPVIGISDAIDVRAGGNLSCALLAGGTVRCWGQRRSGASGTPADVPGIDDAVAIGVGEDFACAMRPATDGGREVWCWGTDSDSAACGGCTGCCADAPRRVDGLPTGLLDFGAGAASHMCVITTGGGVLCWGEGPQLGIGIEGCFCPQGTPVSPPGLSSGVIALAQSTTHDCALLRRASTTEVWCWGSNDTAALLGAYGDGGRTHSSIPLRAAPTIDDARAIAVGRSSNGGSTCVLRASGQVFCFGSDTHGALGNGRCTTPRSDFARPEQPVCGIP